jgi:hypothetical protein
VKGASVPTHPVLREPAALVARLLLALFVAVLAACGGGGDAPPAAATPPATTPPVTTPPTDNPPVATPAANVATITVDRGADGTAFNSPFVTVTVCAPGTANCQTVDHVLVDTGSFGLRLMAPNVPASLGLPSVTAANEAPVAECAHFATGFMWGSVRRADVKISGETAANLPIHVVGDATPPFAAIPTACSNTGSNFGAEQSIKGILGVGLFNQDCPACRASAAPAIYFACPASGGCTSTALPLASQVANPVPAFAANNNGVAITMPPVLLGGAPGLTGSLVFGIGTQPNNQLGVATVYATNGRGNFTTNYKGVNYTASFIDSGSNGIFFTDSSIPQCSGFYCPPSPLTLAAVNSSSNGASGSVTFVAESIQALARSVVVANVGGDAGLSNVFDWGFPFFFGRTVFVAIEGASTPKGNGPYWAY